MNKNNIYTFILFITTISCNAYNIDDLKHFHDRNNCENCDLINADLNGDSNCNLKSSLLIGTNLSSHFDFSNFDSANLKNANFKTACRLCSFDNADLSDASFGKNDLTKSSFKNANFTNASLYESNLSNADFTDANFTNANLRGVILINSNISDEQLSQAKDICDAVLSNGKYNKCESK